MTFKIVCDFSFLTVYFFVTFFFSVFIMKVLRISGSLVNCVSIYKEFSPGAFVL